MTKSYTNQEIAELLRSIAAAYVVKNEDRFKIMAYENAAASVEHATSDVKDLWDDNKLDQLAGVGSSIASHLDELFKTGKVAHFDEVKKDLPKAMFVLLAIPGIGPKTAFRLAGELKLREGKEIVDLENMGKKGKIREIEGFGEKTEKDILEGIVTFKKGQTKEKRMLLLIADSLAHEILNYLEKCPAVIQGDALGSLRRMVSTIGDIDIAVKTNKPQIVIEWFIKYPKIKKVLSKGEKSLVRVILNNGKQIDLRLQNSESYGAMLQYFTGSKAHNISLREYAISKGISLSEYGIKTKNRSGKWELKKYDDEVRFYKTLEMDWIPPELREDQGEILAAARHQLPDLVELKDIKGDLHIHSDFPIETSHDEGGSSIGEVMEVAAKLGYEYLGFSEHNPSVSKHRENEIIAIIKKKKALIEQINYSNEKRTNILPIKILNGLEIDIQPSGKLALPEQAFKYLDYAIASIHSSFNLSRTTMTKRVIKALAHPKIKIFGHPTGRMLNRREGYELDWEIIFDFCLKNNKWLEINCWPERLDLPDSLVFQAVKKGVKIIINTDSHQADQLNLMEYGVAVARRGWAEKSDIINSLNLKDFLNEINSL